MSPTSSKRLRSLLAVLGSGLVLPSVVSAETDGSLTYHCSWLGNSLGGDDHVQKDGLGLAVEADGSCVVPAGWDEHAKGVGVYRDGKSAGNMTGISSADGAVAVSPQYIYVGNHRRQTKTSPWVYGVTRWFTDGRLSVWGKSVGFLPIGPQWLGGMCWSNGELFIADPSTDRVRVFDGESMLPLRDFACPHAFRLTVAGDHLWVVEPEAGHNDPTPGTDSLPGTDTVVAEYSLAGQPTGRQIAAPNTMSVAADPQGHLLVAGPRKQVLIYNVRARTPTIIRTIGQPGGIYSGQPGVMATDKLLTPWGVGCDASGNVYVLGRVPATGGGVDLRSFSPSGALNWHLISTQFTDVCDVDPASGGKVVYTRDEIFRYEPGHGDGSNWAWTGYTLDPKYDDGRAEGRQGHDMFVWGSPLVRRVNGKLIVYMRPGDRIGVFRQGAGDVLVPSSVIDLARNWKIKTKRAEVAWPSIQPPQSRWLWTDSNGDGKMQPDEFENHPEMIDEVEFISGSWVDDDGNIWLSGSHMGIRTLWEIPLQKFDAVGNPIYTMSTMVRIPLPPEFKQVERLVYDKASDTMYLSGETPTLPKAPNFGSLGTAMVCYQNWSTPNRSIKWQFNLPNDATIMSGYFTSFTVAGDKIFCIMRNLATIYVFSAKTGQLLGHLKPGPAVGNYSGWCDMEDGVSAYARADGHILVFAEDDLRSRIVTYDVDP